MLIILSLIIGSLYYVTQANTIYGGDAGDLAAAIKTIGIAHPPGYPLYTLLGIILNSIIPLGTLAWRVGLVSSLSSLVALIYLYKVLFILTKKIYISFISVLTLAFLYPIWLYSIVAEVFALNNLFLILLLYFGVKYRENRKIQDLYILSLVLGLSLSHHHIIVFTLPSLILLLYPLRTTIKLRNIFIMLILLLVGLLPYLYIIIASFSNPSLNWMGGPTAINFWNVITRVGYGTFTAGKFIAYEPGLRLYSIVGFLDFVYKDFRVLGIILILFGFYWMFKKRKDYFFFFTSLLASYLFFLFYASFPLTENFMVATFERFIQPLYFILSFFVAYGLIYFAQLIEKLIKRIVSYRHQVLVTNLFLGMLIIYPVGLIILNYPKISILKNDFTAENLGRDILNTVEDNAVLIISSDTPLFNTQYVYWSENEWQDVKLIHLSKLWTSFYRSQLEKLYPIIELYDENISSDKKFETFIEKNYKKFPIYSKQSFKSDNGVWLPYGLLFRYYKNGDEPSNDKIIKINEDLWVKYNDPLSGSLGIYQNLMLSDVLRSYAFARQEIGFWMAKKGYIFEAEKHLLEAKRLYPQDLDSNIILAQVYIIQKKCNDSKNETEEVISKNPDDADSLLVLSINYAVCFKDEVKAREYQALYESKRRGREIELRLL